MFAQNTGKTVYKRYGFIIKSARRPAAFYYFCYVREHKYAMYTKMALSGYMRFIITQLALSPRR